MIRKFHEAVKLGQSQVTLWGTGSPRREFLHVDDAASAVLFALENTLEENLYNVGTGEDLSVAELADLDRKSTRLNSSHVAISYAVYCLKKKKKYKKNIGK